MFTGIVEEIGTIKQIRRGKYSAAITVQAKGILEGTKTGDSIAVNGICLTVTTLSDNTFTADIMHETLKRSTFAEMSVGNNVNLERAMPADGRFGGHMVAGHVDGIGKIIQIQKDDTAILYTIQTKPEIMRYIVEKGSVTIDGISLTVARVQQRSFLVSVIPHTQKQTTLYQRQKGDFVNLENDIIGKYVEKLTVHFPKQKESRLTKEFLTQYGFLEV